MCWSANETEHTLNKIAESKSKTLWQAFPADGELLPKDNSECTATRLDAQIERTTFSSRMMPQTDECQDEEINRSKP